LFRDGVEIAAQAVKRDRRRVSKCTQGGGFGYEVATAQWRNFVPVAKWTEFFVVLSMVASRNTRTGTVTLG